MKFSKGRDQGPDPDPVSDPDPIPIWATAVRMRNTDLRVSLFTVKGRIVLTRTEHSFHLVCLSHPPRLAGTVFTVKERIVLT
jgi:hypothetical protein